MSRLAEEVILWSTREFGFVDAARLLVDRVEHHAAEEEPRHRRARPRQGRAAGRQPDRAAGHAQGAAARLQPGPPGGQGAGLRLRRHPRGAAAGLHRPGRHAAASTPPGWPSSRPRASRWPPTSPSGWCAQGVPFRVAHEVAGACVRRCEELGIELHDLDRRASSPRSRPHLTPGGPLGADRRGLGRLPPRTAAAPRPTGSASSCAELAAVGRTRTVSARSADLADAARTARCSRWRPALLGADAAARRRRRPAHRGRGVRRRRRPRLARLPGPHRPQRGDVRPARPPLRLLHLRDAPLLQRRLRARGHARARCCSAPGRSSTASSWPGRGGRGRATATWRAARPGSARRSASTATTNGADLDRRAAHARARRAAPATVVDRARAWACGGAPDRPWRFWLPGEPTVSRYRPAPPGRAAGPRTDTRFECRRGPLLALSVAATAAPTARSRGRIAVGRSRAAPGGSAPKLTGSEPDR